MAKLIKLKKGFDLRLEGAIASAEVTDGEKSQHFAVIPDDFRGVIPRMEVKEGARVAVVNLQSLSLFSNHLISIFSNSLGV